MSKKFICNPWIVIWWNGSFMSKKVICSPWILLALAGWICPEPVAAVQVDDLYVAEVMVTSQDDRELALAARQGLRTVLTRISGVTDVDQEEAVRLALQTPRSTISSGAMIRPTKLSRLARRSFQRKL